MLGGPPTGEWVLWREMFDRLLKECWENDIVTVIAAGNKGADGYTLDSDIPATLGTSTNPLITVGASDVNGIRWPGTTIEDHDNTHSGSGGSISIWAQGDNTGSVENIQCAKPGTQGFQMRHGTSVAAPQIAGLAAYFLSIPIEELNWDAQQQPTGSASPLPLDMGPPFYAPDLHTKGQVAGAVRYYLMRMSYIRGAEGVNVAYNGANEDRCKVLPGSQVHPRGQATNATVQRDNFGLTPIFAEDIHRRDTSSLVILPPLSIDSKG